MNGTVLRDPSSVGDPGTTTHEHPVSPVTPAERAIRRLLLGDDLPDVCLPPATELASALQTLQQGHRVKVLLALPSQAVEYALVLDGQTVLVSCYGTTNTPEVHVLNRPVPMANLLGSCHQYASQRAQQRPECPVEKQAVQVAERAVKQRVRHRRDDRMTTPAVLRRGGAVEKPHDRVALAFGYAVRLQPDAMAIMGTSERADVHALLFDGDLWAWARGQRIAVATGPIMLATQRMLEAVAAIVDAVRLRQKRVVRLKSGKFRIGFTVGEDLNVSLSVGTDNPVSVNSLTPQQATLPILRLASDLLRMMVSTDRTQSRNLRVRALRAEVRRLRRRVRGQDLPTGFVNEDTDRFRASLHEGNQPTAHWQLPAGLRGLRFVERWRQDLPDFDGANTYLCGNRLVFSGPEQSLALCRDTGKLQWLREGSGGPSMMAGRVLVRQHDSGRLELCDVESGAGLAFAELDTRVTRAHRVTYAGARDVPPVILVTDGGSRLLAIDARTGQLRWRFTAKGGGPLKLRRAGRLLLLASGGRGVHAVDVASGEEVWRFMAQTTVTLAPGVAAHTAVIAEGGNTSFDMSEGMLHGVDVVSGKKLWEREMDAAPLCTPIACGDRLIVAWGSREQSSVASIASRSGELLWASPDPGIAAGGAPLPVDDVLVMNAPGGKVVALDLDDGSIRWWRSLADPVADEIPRNLEPVLRGGALFVPAASVHVLRPQDGRPMGAVGANVVPDFLRVDERGWVYTGEENGALVAHATQPHLQLVP